MGRVRPSRSGSSSIDEAGGWLSSGACERWRESARRFAALSEALNRGERRAHHPGTIAETCRSARLWQRAPGSSMAASRRASRWKARPRSAAPPGAASSRPPVPAVPTARTPVVVLAGLGVRHLRPRGHRLPGGSRRARSQVLRLTYPLTSPRPSPLGASAVARISEGRPGARLLARIPLWSVPRRAWSPARSCGCGAATPVGGAGGARRPAAGRRRLRLRGPAGRRGIAGELLLDHAASTGGHRDGSPACSIGCASEPSRAVASGHAGPRRRLRAGWSSARTSRSTPPPARTSATPAGSSAGGERPERDAPGLRCCAAVAGPRPRGARGVALLALVACYVPLAGAVRRSSARA